ncbi:FAD-dependent oxidoreductase [Paracoccus fistulariae]|uniref:FAD-dependent oxidoreductase n=1 Tax=Paracoccus fistulariae TaxID=658446 RepID=A0ABY7SIU2_9RHOB|nr:FAD-dependent oxidoreductase [Paracoccus fistulariae]MDB6180845.1 FAD-dependent oxidoreductase [Paracoccus fistulariae]WCR06935.1 FAD-dependent oxidoreductase [Paracoccus fistulariae]
MANIQGIPVYKEIGQTPAPAIARDHAPVVVVGAGPVGLAMALDLGRRGHQVTVITRLDFIAHCSKAICFSKRSLDILDRLGVCDAVMQKGVTWNLGKVFWGDGAEPVYQFDMLPVKDQKHPGFINIQQYYIEEYLLDGLRALPNVDLRWGHVIEEVTPRQDGVLLDISTDQGRYQLMADWLIACDGARSTVRERMGLDFEGRVFEDNFLIADIRMPDHQMPPERWFWFDPPFNPGRSALMHRQPDGVWRLDFQLGWNIDREAATRPENVEPFIRAMLGDEVAFEREWYSVYTFQCRRMARFVHGRVIFAGDSAHLVSPFGARGCNGGFADIDNLGWKLDLVLRGHADETLIETYNHEAVATADENILNSTRSTDFLTPKSAASQALRDAVLELARDHDFARPFVNSGRLSTPVGFPESPLSTPDEDAWSGGVPPGAPVLDSPHEDGWLMEQLGDDFVLLSRDWAGEVPPGLRVVQLGQVAADRLGLGEGGACLIRPDHYVAARWKNPDAARIEAALARAKGGQIWHS